MKKELWVGLRRYRFEHLVPPHLADRVAAAFGGSDMSTRAFASKVARKNGWTTPYALRAIAEYKKFVYLGMVADFSVTPSKAIDAVWHEHLLFTAPYRDFCREVLGRPFDHHPELVPEKGQTDAFQAQFAATLELYRAEFNSAPPADIWGTPKFGRPDADRPAAPSVAARRWRDAHPVGVSTSDDAPLYTYFEVGAGHSPGDSAVSGGGSSSGDSAFGGGGGFSGAGGGSSWASDADPGSGDGSSGDAGSDGGDGGSGCSSSCGGGE